MINTVIINGSPKVKNSGSSRFIEKIEEFIGKSTVYQATQLIQMENNSEAILDILKAEVFLFVFPLYIDSLPAPLIKVLTMLEQAATDTNGKSPRVYAICNCGFFEAEHTQVALDILKNFSTSLGMRWGYGIGIGGGGLVSSQSKNISKDGSASNVYTVLLELGNEIENSYTKKQNIFVSPKIPRFLYKLGGNLGWCQMAIKYGTIKSIKAKPHILEK
ncbi:MAG: hypothetical protein FWH29_04345 [Methanobrevibacter sp.]|nr:hypothetical protein [Methanobrevibacter sp.]